MYHFTTLTQQDGGGGGVPDMGRSKRRRVKAARYADDIIDNEEARLIQRAIENSKRETERLSLPVESAPVFHPTIEDFKNPLQYINRLGQSAIYVSLIALL